MSADHDPLCPLAPYAQRIAEGEWDAGAFIDDDGKVQYLGCDCDLIARVRADERAKARQRVEAIEHWASYSPDGDVWACYASDPAAAAGGDA